MNHFYVLLVIIIFIESSEVVLSQITQPILTSLVFVLMGAPLIPTMLAAIAIQLFYLDFSPSGASIYPEYSVSFALSIFSYLISGVTIENNLLFGILFFLTIMFSYPFSYILHYKRKLIWIVISKFTRYKSVPNFKKTIFTSIFFGLVILYPVVYILMHFISIIILKISFFKPEFSDYNLIFYTVLGFAIVSLFRMYRNTRMRKYLIIGNLLSLILLFII
ncbi:MAG: hypothetical protein JXR48_11055 [Candidatus Delongbacteria bacterium]|nr:hypothetical protein [Candidatus Delongbacteria bacterium]MBN2835491.1 hypothetical protein [Candidatus Delongbacteria bacterium]